MDIANRTGIITGAGSGIGGSLAIGFGQRGGNLLLVGRRHVPLEETAQMVRSVGGQAEVLDADITEPGAVERVAEVARQRGPVDLLVNNAGNVRAGHLEDLPEEDVLAMIALNLTAPILLTRALLAALKEAASPQGSVLLAVSSGIALTGLPFYTVYAATKSGISTPQTLPLRRGRADDQRQTLRPRRSYGARSRGGDLIMGLRTALP
ncbi:SDR family oxidoreductase [Arthrobacter sp. B1805]|uniref:SDR family NAD(P)-dependent oxidoreductase n=1 Tax=Arthrobacter sp. B1805 TaxID=2058892 RepID=UPI0015E3F785|nr:SDR family NAD(P)-dependent oxidoreductase [Arthrobacter sp. B1805]